MALHPSRSILLFYSEEEIFVKSGIQKVHKKTNANPLMNPSTRLSSSVKMDIL